MSGLFSSCFAAIATLLKKQKPIAFNVMLMMLMMMVVNGDAVDARGDEGDDDFAGDNASGGDEESSELFPPLLPRHGGQGAGQGRTRSRAVI